MTNKQSSSLAYLVSICSATERALRLPTAPSGMGPLPSFKSQSSGAGGERAETAGGVEVERRAERREATLLLLLQGWAPGLSPAAWECVIQAARSGASFSQASGGPPPRQTPPSRRQLRSGSEADKRQGLRFQCLLCCVLLGT